MIPKNPNKREDDQERSNVDSGNGNNDPLDVERSHELLKRSHELLNSSQHFDRLDCLIKLNKLEIKQKTKNEKNNFLNRTSLWKFSCRKIFRSNLIVTTSFAVSPRSILQHSSVEINQSV
jgi:hypothetical protein